MKCKVCERTYHACTNCDHGGIPWEMDGFCSGDCFYEWSSEQIFDLKQQLAKAPILLRQRTIRERDEARKVARFYFHGGTTWMGTPSQFSWLIDEEATGDDGEAFNE